MWGLTGSGDETGGRGVGPSLAYATPSASATPTEAEPLFPISETTDKEPG